MNGSAPGAVAEPSRLWFSVLASQLRARADPEYAVVAMTVEQRYAQSAHPLIPLGDLALLVQYGSSARPEQAGNVRVLRMNNLTDGQLELSNHKWLTLPAAEIERYRLESGDLLFNRTNSKERVGKCAVFRADGQWVFASYLIRVRVMTERVTPEFVAVFLSSPSGRLQIDRDSRQIIGMANVNGTELREFVVPLPPLAEQRRLTQPVELASEAVEKARAATKHADAKINQTLLSRLDVVVGDPSDLQTFSVETSALRGQRLDARAYMPIVQLRGKGPESRVTRLGEIAEINPRRPAPEEHEGMVPYVGLPECSQVRIERVVLRDKSDPIGRNVAVNGDILFARIEPSIFNRKYVFVRDLTTHQRVLTSAEFFVISADPQLVDVTYLHEVLLSEVIARQIVGKTTGSSGRRRLDRDVLATLTIPLPELNIQESIADELRRQRRITEETQMSAEASWRDAVNKFELALFYSQ